MNAMYNISLESLFEAYWDCRKNKSRASSASEFEVHYESNLIQLHNEIATGQYAQKKSITFVITKPDYREIFAAHFRDRIVHHWIRQRIEPIFEKVMIPTTFSCRKGKGTLASQKYVAQAIREVSNDYTTDCYVMKLDIKGFFMSIDRQRICDKVSRFVADQYHEADADTLLFLINKVLLNAPEDNCEKRGDLTLWKHIKPHKSLFTNGEGKGLPIGDLIVQMAANLLLNDTDHFITDTLGIKMARYVDDMVLISDSKQALLNAVPMIREYMQHTSGVMLHPNKFYLQHYTKGVKFIGAVAKKGRTYISNRTVNNAFGCIRRFNRNKDGAEDFVASVNSYLGLMRHHATYNIRKRLVRAITPEWYQSITAVEDFSKITAKETIYNRIKKSVKRGKYEETRLHLLSDNYHQHDSRYRKFIC